MSNRIIYLISVICLIGLGNGAARAQVSDMGVLPFLGAETDSRSAGMAGTGVTQTDSPFAVYHNAATSSMGGRKLGIGMFAGPWSTGFKTADVLLGGSGYYRFGSNSVLAGFRYIAGPEIEMMDDHGFPTGTARSRDMAADIGYARRLSDHIALSLTARWVISDQGFGDPSVNAFAFDVGAAYKKGLSFMEGAFWAAGVRLADVGPRVKMSDGEKYNLPSRAVAGGSVMLPFTPRHVLMCALDVNYRFAGSFGAALGAEYTFLKHGVVRAGYHFGPGSKGPGSYATLGCGFIAGPVNVDFAYRLGGEQTNPLRNTFIFSLGFSM